jgi:hypothetical protein
MIFIVESLFPSLFSKRRYWRSKHSQRSQIKTLHNFDHSHSKPVFWRTQMKKDRGGSGEVQVCEKVTL